MSTTQEFHPGDRVSTPAGNTGSVREPPFDNPLYSLISIDGGATIWIRNDLLKPSDTPDPGNAQKRRRKAKQLY